MRLKKIKLINLIPESSFESKTLGKVLKWMLTTFRIMVIVTELVVMSAFLSRFWLDAKNSDLNETIAINKSQILAYSEVEKDFRSLQNRVLIAKELYNQPKINNLLLDITKLTPSDVILNSIIIGGEELQIKALSYSEQSVAQFVVNLEKYQGVENVELSQISSNIELGLSTLFTINARVNNQFLKDKNN